MAEAGEVCDVMKKFCELDTQIFLSVTEIRKGKGRADNTSILKSLLKKGNDVSKDLVNKRVSTLIDDGKLINRRYGKSDSLYVNENDTTTKGDDESLIFTPNYTEKEDDTESKGNEYLEAHFSALKNFVMEEIYDINKKLEHISESENTTRVVNKEKIDIIDILKVQIRNLKEELATKNIIIQTFVENQNSLMRDIGKFSQPSHENSNEFVKPKEHIKSNKIRTLNDNNEIIITENRFDVLCNDKENHENDINITTDDEVIITYNQTNNSNVDKTFITTRTTKASKGRPSVVVNQHPENQTVFGNIVRPGNSSYSDITRYGKNIKIICDSIPKGLRMYEFNKYVESGRASIATFPGATAKRLLHYCLPTLADEKPEVVVIHVGCNDLSTKRGEALNQTVVNEVADVIIDMGKVCIKNGVNKVFISSIVCSKNFMKQKLINELNDVLKERCVVYGFVFINNSNIKKEHLWKDGTHLVEEGKVILAKKFIKSLNNFLCQLLQTPVNR